MTDVRAEILGVRKLGMLDSNDRPLYALEVVVTRDDVQGHDVEIGKYVDVTLEDRR